MGPHGDGRGPQQGQSGAEGEGAVGKSLHCGCGEEQSRQGQALGHGGYPQ